jgi:toxin ParE1/3/4
MPTVKYTQAANVDLLNIINFTFETWGADQADTYIDGLEKLAQTLSEAPNLGKARADLAKGLRSFSYQSHVLYFIEATHGITVVRVLHENMNVGAEIAK